VPRMVESSAPTGLAARRMRVVLANAYSLFRRCPSFVVLIIVAGTLYFGCAGIQVTKVLVPADIRSFSGFAYVAPVPRGDELYPLVLRSDSLQDTAASKASLREDGVKLGPRHTITSEIANTGSGAYFHLEDTIIFSTSDNSDPRTNGRTYTFHARAYLSLVWFWPLLTGGILLLGGARVVPWVRAWRPAMRLDAMTSPGGRLLYITHCWRASDPAIRGRARTALIRASVQSAAAAALAFVAIELPEIVRGPLFWLTLGGAMMVVLLAVRNLTSSGVLLLGWDRHLGAFQNAALAAAAVSISLAGFELFLGYAEGLARKDLKSPNPPADEACVATHFGKDCPAESRNLKNRAEGALPIRTGRAEIVLPASIAATIRERRELITMPAGWETERASVPGATWAYRWQGVIHIFDRHKYRRLNGPFPAKNPEVFRIMVAGDSITYGAGLEATWSYPAQLERLLQKEYNVEVINLGRNGDQSADVLQSIEKMTPVLKPDLIVYGVCLNDFLPSGIGQYTYSYSVPLPQWLKTAALQRTRLAHLMDDGYKALLLALHMRRDFFDDILSNFGDYQIRFDADVARMNKFALAQGVRPIVGVVLDQFPTYGGRGHRIAAVADESMRKAQFDLIPAEDYYRSYDGRRFFVSRWEGHPDEEAHAIFATRIADHLYGRSDLERHRKKGSN
jgi:GDSL-like lipase/acylhydrolase family protein